MTDALLNEDKFFDCCFRLETADIIKLDQEDNGPINNVVAGIATHCYGTKLYDDEYGLMAEMFYINGRGQLRGDIIQLQVKDIGYYGLLLRFCMLLADDYEEVDALAAFNTFQQKLRGFLEKLEFFTVTSLELKPFSEQNAIMMSSASRGIIKLDLIDPKEFYRDFFGNIADRPVEKGKEYVYLMVNSDTGLIKIGKSINPAYRERTLHSQEPAVHLIAMWCCGKQVEKELHKMFIHKRVRGEWFRLTISDMTTLEKFMIDR
jgi:hypothetical protein